MVPLIGVILCMLVPTSLACQVPQAEAIADSMVARQPRLFDSLRTVDGPALTAEERRGFLLSPAQGWSLEMLPRSTPIELLRLTERRTLPGYSSADGLYIGIGSDRPQRIFSAEQLFGYAGGGYGFGSHYWQVYGGLYYDFFTRPLRLRIGLEGHIITDTRDRWKMEELESTMFAAVAGLEPRDYFQRRGYSLGATKQLGSRTSVSVEYRYDRYANSHREASWSIFGIDHPFDSPPPVRQGEMRSVAANMQLDYTTLRSWSSPKFALAGEVEFGEMNEGSFTTLTLDGRLKSTLVDDLLWVSARARISSSSGESPPQRMVSIGGFGSLPGYPQNEFRGNRMVLLQTDLLFSPFALLTSATYLKMLRIIFSNDIGGVSAVSGSNPLLTGFPSRIQEIHYSPGVYVGTATGVLRLGIAWRTDVGRAPVVVLRLAGGH